MDTVISFQQLQNIFRNFMISQHIDSLSLEDLEDASSIQAQVFYEALTEIESDAIKQQSIICMVTAMKNFQEKHVQEEMRKLMPQVMQIQRKLAELHGAEQFAITKVLH
ncbi:MULTISPECIES: hypothetical protein [Vibrio]|uniref:Uncharacterized protein n=4 Tax=Vibrio TaxID=662 RepID=A0AAN0W021_9VIBR|nr:MULTISPECIES: hypothetical protein [Vibrio]CAH1587699.1 conserved hypothetical protein [Vibrio jasicida]AIW22443.1 hypothetical protein IX92_25595 [Vibrio coralliilyticus]KIF53377.1 hypothetical protein H735_10680 [Vibrio owensii CAIM 1854 = LMG 25443]NOH37004.1 hypothetical protein [Vibrio coralliilyticus]PAW02519.1 hypothetical protein CKJ79_17795 [Vibrio coralliilyticus]